MGDRAPRDLSRQALAEVVEARYEELFQLIHAKIRGSGYEDMIPAGIVLTGGTAKMEGAVELAEEVFHMPVRVGGPQAVQGMAELLRNPVYSTAVGLLVYGLRKQKDGTPAEHGELVKTFTTIGDAAHPPQVQNNFN